MRFRILLRTNKMIVNNLTVFLAVGCAISIVSQNILHGFPLSQQNVTTNSTYNEFDSKTLATSTPLKPKKRAAEHLQIVHGVPWGSRDNRAHTKKLKAERPYRNRHHKQNLRTTAAVVIKSEESVASYTIKNDLRLFSLGNTITPSDGEISTSSMILKGLIEPRFESTKAETFQTETKLSSTIPDKVEKELTTSLQRYTINSNDNVGYKAWQFSTVTRNPNERFFAAARGTVMRPVAEYYPQGTLSTVCLGRSSIYNIPKVYSWLPRHIYNHSHVHRPIWLDLRREIYKFGNSEECHTTNLTTWREYQECALKRNQRMEYMVPKYPLHQIGYYSRWSQYISER